mmetsp:Transcript_25397/g.70696  ORF Transcript_25397/g.70696 Transcript_25397/m.70696 type:complete len:283 (+) Transcript_25397:89-937(+)
MALAMTYSSSAPRLHGSTLSKTGFTKTGFSRSSTSLVAAAAFNLRDFSASRKKLATDRPSSETASRRAPYGEIDLVGGNGKWRQRRAEEDFERRRLEEQQRQREEQRREAERRRNMELAEARRRRLLEEEEQRRLEEQERKRLEQLQREREIREREEQERLRLLEEESERQRRRPKTCETCGGSAVCQTCSGDGYVYVMYLASEVDWRGRQNDDTDFGKLQQGCTSCGGYEQGVRGELQTGCGKCAACGGAGKIWPQIEQSPTKSQAHHHHHHHSSAALQVR